MPLTDSTYPKWILYERRRRADTQTEEISITGFAPFLGTVPILYTSYKHQKTFGWEHCSHIIPPANTRKPLAGNIVPILYLLQTPENLWLGTLFPYYTSCKHQKTFGWEQGSHIIPPANTRKPLVGDIVLILYILRTPENLWPRTLTRNAIRNIVDFTNRIEFLKSRT